MIAAAARAQSEETARASAAGLTVPDRPRGQVTVTCQGPGRQSRPQCSLTGSVMAHRCRFSELSFIFQCRSVLAVRLKLSVKPSSRDFMTVA